MKRFRGFFRLFILVALILLTACFQQNKLPSLQEKEASKLNQGEGLSYEQQNPLLPHGPTLPQLPSQSLKAVNGIVDKHLQLTNLGTPTSPLRMRLLIVSPTDTDNTLDALIALCKNIGIPYDVLIATQESLTQNTLVAADGTGLYQGIILTDDALSYSTDGGQTFVSAFTSAEWNLLWNYEKDFAVRQVAMFSFPDTFPESVGLSFVSGKDTTNPNPRTPPSQQSTSHLLKLNMTSTGQQIFSSLKSSAQIPVEYAYVYLSQLDNNPNETVTPLLEDNSGNIVGALSTNTDGRERITLTMGHNPFLLHTNLLGYDLVNWVTKGLFIGARRYHLHIDVDDWFQFSDVWDINTEANSPTEEFRVSATDTLAIIDNIQKFRLDYPLAENFMYNIVFNTLLADQDADPDCVNPATMTEATLCVVDIDDPDGDLHLWGVNHTYTEQDMDFTDFATSKFEIRKNIRVANSMGLNHNRNSLVTGTHSGLGYYMKHLTPNLPCVVEYSNGYCEFGLEHSNTDLLSAAKRLRVKYMGANRSLQTHTADCESCGIVHPLESTIMLVPRWASNVFYNIKNPQEALSEYNYFYGPDSDIDPYWNGNLTDYEEDYLVAEADIALYHILTFSPYPHFFHQANLHEYQTGKSLITDWAGAILEKYSLYIDLPLVSMEFPDMADYIKQRTSAHYAEITGTLDRYNEQITISVSTDPNNVVYPDNTATIHVTGTSIGDFDGTGDNIWEYGGVEVSSLIIANGQSQTYYY